ncbi:MAG: hypothetical protein JJU13_02260 [Balneolaceae bacterium]|nr:hypothetical protein [Balneolaceae bacterium]
MPDDTSSDYRLQKYTDVAAMWDFVEKPGSRAGDEKGEGSLIVPKMDANGWDTGSG